MHKQDIAQNNLLNRLNVTLKDALTSLDWDQLCRYNQGYKGYREDPFLYFVCQEWPYYQKVLNWFTANVEKGSRVLDVGMFVPVMPLLLSWHGYEVVCVEKFGLYADAFDKMIGVAQQNGIEVINDDIVSPQFDYHGFDVICVLCIIEHLLGSPKKILLNLKDKLSNTGKLVVAVPNHARLVKRLGLLAGISVHPDYASYFESDYPFEGHHREYTMKELKYLIENTGFEIDLMESVNYPPVKCSAIRAAITRAAGILPLTFHQVLIAVAGNRT